MWRCEAPATVNPSIPSKPTPTVVPEAVAQRPRSTAQITVLFVVLILSIVLLFANFAYLNTQSSHDKQYIGHAGELRVLSQRIAKNATEAAAGKALAFRLLSDARNDFERRWKYLREGDKTTGLPPAPATVRDEMDAVRQDWENLRRNTDTILASEQTVLSLHQVAATLAETVPQLQVEYEKVVEILLQSGAPASQVAVAQRQLLLAERILGSVNTVLGGDEAAVQAADTFGRDASRFGQVLQGMLDGNAAIQVTRVEDPDARARLAEIAELFQFVSGSVDEILETSPELQRVREAASNIFSLSQTLLDEASHLATGFENLAGRTLDTVGGYVLGLLALTSIILIGLVMVRATNRQLRDTAQKNERNQQAIMRLLDEIEELADGDLTVNVSVTEDFTGAIADSINYSVDQLRDLVATINHSAEQVAAGYPEHRAPVGQGLGAPGRSDQRGVAGGGRHGRVDRPRVGPRLRVGQGGRALGGHRQQRQRSGAQHHRRHGQHPRADPGHRQAHQAPGRVVPGDRRYRQPDRRHCRADQHSGAQRGDPGVAGGGGRSRFRGGRR